jgi:acyl-coenzyme A thioesterase PaaI-like protein
MQAIFDAIPYSKFLGLSARMDGDELITTMKFDPSLIGNPSLPALHGGTLGALLESSAIFELLWRAETIVLPKTITLTVDYLRSGQPIDTHARSIVTRHGRRVANVRVEAWQADRNAPVATAHAIFLVMREASTS